MIIRREVWRDVPWVVSPVIVVEDTPEQLVVFTPTGAPFGFPRSADGRPHPWIGRSGWSGHGMLAVQRPGEAYSVMHFWHGPKRTFAGWYLNLQEPFRRTPFGIDTQDLELDLWIPVEGVWEFKDLDLLDQRVAEGRFTAPQRAAIEELGTAVGELVSAGAWWWDPAWATFAPPVEWGQTSLPDGWENIPCTPNAAPGELVALPSRRHADWPSLA